MQPIYIEISDEITTVIERIRESGHTNIALIVPKGAILLQSIVNLKLIKKTYNDLGLNLVLITTDKIGRNLANQVGIHSYTKFDPNGPLEEDSETEDPNVVSGVKVHKYYDENDNEISEEEEEIQPIIPRELVDEKPIIKVRKIGDEEVAPVEAPVETPAGALKEASKETTKETSSKISEDIKRVEVVEVIKTRKVEPSEVAKPVAEASVNKIAPNKATDEIKILPTEEVASTAEEVAQNTTKAIERLNEKKESLHKKEKKNRSFFFAYLIVILIIAGAGVSYAYLPKVQVAITLPSESWTKDMTVVASLNPDATDPLQMKAEEKVIELTDELTFEATGTKNVGDKATGTATLYNYEATTAQTVPAGFRISASGKYFVTQSAVAVPGYTKAGVGKPIVPGSNTVAIVAEVAGADSNLNNATTANLTGTDISLSATVTTTGGSSKEVKIVSPTDIANARVALSKQIQDKITEQINTEVPADKYYFKASEDIVAITDFKSTVAAETEATSGKASAKGSLKRIIAEKSAQIAKIKEASAKDIPQNTNQIIQTINAGDITINKDDGKISIPTNVTGVNVPLLDLEGIKKKIPTKKFGSIELLIKDASPTATVEIKQTPSWWPIKSAPVSSRYIEVKVNNE